MLKNEAPSFTFAVDLMNWSNPLTTVMPFFSSDFDDLEARIVNLSKSCKFPGEAFRLIVPNSCETQMKSIGNFIRPLIDKKASLEMFVDHLKSQIYLQGNEKVEQTQADGIMAKLERRFPACYNFSELQVYSAPIGCKYIEKLQGATKKFKNLKFAFHPFRDVEFTHDTKVSFKYGRKHENI